MSINRNISRSQRTKLKAEIMKTIDATFVKCQGMRQHDTAESDAYWEMSEALMEFWSQVRGEPLRRRGVQAGPVEKPQPKPEGLTVAEAIEIGNGVQAFARACGGKPIGEK